VQVQAHSGNCFLTLLVIAFLNGCPQFTQMTFVALYYLYGMIEVCFLAPYVGCHCVLKQRLTAHTNGFCRLTLLAFKIALTPLGTHLAFLGAVASYVQYGRQPTHTGVAKSVSCASCYMHSQGGCIPEEGFERA
jgi:hypothetical protein